jgi:disulfide oxidoreductase YuzD
MKQSSIEWLDQELPKNFNIKGVQILYDSILEQAKEMHKQEIIEAHEKGQNLYSDVIRCDKSKNYYNETFKQ